MSATIHRFQVGGAPATLFENAFDEASEVDFALVVMVRKDGTIATEWSTLPSNLAALGAIDMLKSALMEAAF